MLHLPRSQCFVLAVPLDQRCDTFSKTLKTHGAFSFGLKLFYCLLWLRASRVPAPWNRKCVLNAFMCVCLFQKDKIILNLCMSAYESMHISMCILACMWMFVCIYNMCVIMKVLWVILHQDIVMCDANSMIKYICDPRPQNQGHFFFIEIYISQSRINKLSIDWLVKDNIWLRYNYLKICNLRVQKNINIDKMAFKVVQMKFLAMHITNQKVRFYGKYIYCRKFMKYLIGTWSLPIILMIFGFDTLCIQLIHNLLHLHILLCVDLCTSCRMCTYGV